MLEALVALDWVGRLEEDGHPRYVLLCDPADAARAAGRHAAARSDTRPRAVWKRAGFGQLRLAEILAEPATSA